MSAAPPGFVLVPLEQHQQSQAELAQMRAACIASGYRSAMLVAEVRKAASELLVAIGKAGA